MNGHGVGYNFDYVATAWYFFSQGLTPSFLEGYKTSINITYSGAHEGMYSTLHVTAAVDQCEQQRQHTKQNLLSLM